MTAGQSVVSLPGCGVASGGEPPAQEEVLAVRLFEGLAQDGGFFAVAAFELGELGGQRADHAGGRVLAGEGGGSGLWPGRLRGAVVLDPSADGGVAVEEVQGDPGVGGEAGR